MKLIPRKTATASLLPIQDGWRLRLAEGKADGYRLAQLDDYQRLRRGKFAWEPPLKLSLRARASAADLPGTWGFGLWNDPFGFSLGFGGNPLRLPCLPNTAWFFSACPHNHLSFQNDKPAQGFLAQVFRSPQIPALFLAPSVVGLPFMAMRSLSRLARRLAGRLIREDSTVVGVDVTGWHTYGLEWNPGRVLFTVDGVVTLETPLSPQGPLGLVLWIDNQYAAWHPDGRLGYGVLPNPPGWLEVSSLECGQAPGWNAAKNP